MVKKPEGIGGVFHYDSLYYDIFPLRPDLSVLAKHGNEGTITQTECDDGDETTETGEGVCDEDDCTALITILVLLPPDAQQWLTGSASNVFLTSTIELLNYAFARSNISHRARAVYEDFTWNYFSGSNPAEDADLLAVDPNAIALKEENNADLVVMLTNFFDPADYGSAVSEVNSVPVPENAAVVHIQQANSPWLSFPHEVGHLFGARHSRETFSGGHFDEPCAAAWEIIPDRYKTVVYQYATTDKVPNYSDPGIYYLGFPTGEGFPEPSNNAGRIRSTGCDVANFYGPQELAVIIGGPGNVCGDPITLTANVQIPPPGNPGQPPFTYEWRWNTDGIFTAQNPGTFLGNTPNINIPPPSLDSCSFIFVKVKITAADGTTGEGFKRIKSTACPNLCPNLD